MSKMRRLKLRIGEGEFEADVPETELQPMYDQFLAALARRAPAWRPKPNFRIGHKLPAFVGPARPDLPGGIPGGNIAEFIAGAGLDASPLSRLFDVEPDGTVMLKMLPVGPDTDADAMLLLLYGYSELRNEECVLATQLFRAADQSGISLRRPANAYAKNARFVIRAGRGKGSNYALRSEGVAKAREILTKLLSAGERGASAGIPAETPARIA